MALGGRAEFFLGTFLGLGGYGYPLRISVAYGLLWVPELAAE